MGDSLRAFHDVCGVLAGGEVEAEQDVRVVGVGRSDSTRDQCADEILADV